MAAHPQTLGRGSADALCWDEAVSLLEMASDAWSAGMDPAQLREALRGALHRLDASDLPDASRPRTSVASG